ncbi:GNAT family N-acetyltransferase [Leifsonia sp. NPDC080035]|uniref:GNAT family N-acetyltransferase n=1 Tax=Leifsonia sp. NPDC080035 TaxID=3143936 RepID=A0AAU7GGJ3_9MICO
MNGLLIGTGEGITSRSVYFTRGYGEAAAITDGGRWTILSTADGSWQLPLVLVPAPYGDGFEARSPYGYAGIHIDPAIGTGEAQRLWRESIEVLRGLDVVTVFLRFSPLDVGSALRARDLEGLTVRHVSDTVLVSTADADSVWNALRGRARTAIRKARAAGMTAELRPATADDLSSGSAFRRLYEGTMARVGAADRYYFADDYYRALLDGLGEDLLVCTVRDAAHGPVAASLVMVDGDGLHYHLSGSTPEGARAGANNLLIWQILSDASARGLRHVHLGGGVSNADSLFRFKESFGGAIVPFHIGSAVIDPVEYDRLVSRRAAERAVPVSALVDSGYFPGFRATEAAG